MNSGRFSVHRLILQLEPLLLFGVLYLPGYLAQTGRINGNMFDSVTFNVSYWLIALSRIGIVLYLVLLRGAVVRRDLPPVEDIESEPEGGSTAALREIGVVRFRMADLPWTLAALAVIEAFVVPVVMVSRSIDKGSIPLLRGDVHWQLGQPMMIPLVLVTSILVGYSEELYFRSYLLTILPKMGVTTAGAVVASVLLFSMGHVYEGVAGVAGAAVIGVVLSLVFLKRRSIHVIALAHGLYNFATLLLTLSGGRVSP